MIVNRDDTRKKCTEYLANLTINNDVAYEQFSEAIK